MEWLPTPVRNLSNVAAPEPSNVPVPRVVAPSMNVTNPPGVPAPGVFDVTVAVKVIDCPNTAGLAEDAITEVEVS